MSIKKFLPRTTEWYINRLTHGSFSMQDDSVNALAKKKYFDPIALLSSKDYLIRRGAMRVLGKRRNVKAIEILVNKGLSDENYLVRDEAVSALGIIGGQEAMKAIVNEGLCDESISVRKAAVWALGRIGGSEAIEEIVSKGLNDKNENIKIAAAFVLASHGNSKAITTLVRALTQIRYSYDRSKVIKALSGLPVEKHHLVDGYINVLNDMDFFNSLKGEVPIHSSHIGPLPGGFIPQSKRDQIYTSICNEIKSSALVALYILGDPIAIDAVSSVLTYQEIDRNVKETAMEVLQRLKENKQKRSSQIFEKEKVLKTLGRGLTELKFYKMSR